MLDKVLPVVGAECAPGDQSRTARQAQTQETLTPQPGTYALLLKLDRHARIRIGALGEFDFPRGWYVYVGSARGAGGLRARVMRHWRGSWRQHWHIDYFRRSARPVRVWYSTDARADECVWARAVGETSSARIIAPRFGASDCDCPTHLWYVGDATSEPPLTFPFT